MKRQTFDRMVKEIFEGNEFDEMEEIKRKRKELEESDYSEDLKEAIRADLDAESMHAEKTKAERERRKEMVERSGIIDKKKK